jgi:microcompartment protein CcmL/EutN
MREGKEEGRYAHGIVSDYLMPELSEKLSTFLKIPPQEVNPKKRKSTLTAEDIKRIKIECKERELAEAEMKTEKVRLNN